MSKELESITGGRVAGATQSKMDEVRARREKRNKSA